MDNDKNDDVAEWMMSNARRMEEARNAYHHYAQVLELSGMKKAGERMRFAAQVAENARRALSPGEVAPESAVKPDPHVTIVGPVQPSATPMAPPRLPGCICASELRVAGVHCKDCSYAAPAL